MKNILELVNTMVEKGASDLHLKAGSPPVMRINGELYLLDEPVINPDQMKDHAASMMNDKQIGIFSEHNDIKSMINQREIGIDTKSYSTALRCVLRQDPDVIFIGEMRDLETVRTA